MGSLRSKSSIWEAIDLAESYLVCCMFDDAASLSSSVLRRLRDGITKEVEEDGEEIKGPDLADMMESAAMVLIQSLKESGRTMSIFSELEGLCGSLAAIPCQVIITGACMQLSEGCTSNLKLVLERFLGVWKIIDEHSLVPRVNGVEFRLESCSSTDAPFLSMDEYLQVVDIYVIQLVGLVLHSIDLAVAWTENAQLPEEKRQELMRRLSSMYPVKKSRFSVDSDNHAQVETAANISNIDGTEESVKTHHYGNKEFSKSKILKAVEPCFWWHRMIQLKCGNTLLEFQCGKAAALGILIILSSYFLRKKWTTTQRFAFRQLNTVKRVVVDAWQLAFSVQVNPLAAIQPLTAAAPPGSR